MTFERRLLVAAALPTQPTIDFYARYVQPRASYGAWLAQFSFTRLYNTVSAAAKDAENVQVFNAVDKQGI